MTTFEMLNHQIKHMLGGIQPEKNNSIEELENFQRRIVRAMEKAQNCHKKIYQGANILKSSLNELSENYMTVFREGKYSGTLIGKVHNEINKFLQEICEESLSLSRKMEGKVENSVPNLKKIKQKYTQSAQTFEHYRQKLQLLKKNVEKQSLANIKQDQHQRFQRNKDKYRNAQKQHDEILMKITKRFYDFNSEGLKDVFHDFVSIISTIAGNIFGISHRVKNNLTQCTTNKDLLLAKHLRHNVHKTGSLNGESKYEKGDLLDCLIEERQISNYLKSMMEKEMTKIQVSENINNVFNRKQTFNKENERRGFDEFKNHYNSLHLRQKQNQSIVEKLQEPQPVEASEDLLSVQELSEMSRGVSGDSVISNDLSLSFEESITEHKKSQENEQKMKNNLQKFNQICEQKKTASAPKEELKNISPFPINSMQYKAVLQKQKTVQVNQFFNFTESKNKKDQKLSKPKEQLVKMHEHLFNFDVLVTPAPASQQKKPPNSISNYASNSNLRSVSPQPLNNYSSNNKNFEAFNFLGQEFATSNKNTSKTPARIGQVKSSELIPRSHKTVVNNFDLFNF